jgi:hypothetical protein
MEMHAIQSEQASMSSGGIVPARQLYRSKHIMVRYRQTGQGEGMRLGEVPSVCTVVLLCLFRWSSQLQASMTTERHSVSRVARIRTSTATPTQVRETN